MNPKALKTFRIDAIETRYWNTTIEARDADEALRKWSNEDAGEITTYDSDWKIESCEEVK